MKYIKLFEKQEESKYSMYEIITMTPGMAGEVLIEEFEKDNPNEELIKNILQHSPVDVNMIVKPQIDFTALMWASSWGYTEITKACLARPEIDVNLQDFGSTALMFASICGRTEIVKLLLEHPHIDVNMQNSDGRTALMFASRNGRTEIVKLLLERPEIDVNLRDNESRTAWYHAKEYIREQFPELKG